MWLEYVPDMLAAVKQGHNEFRALIKKNKALCTAKSRELENHLADMVDALGWWHSLWLCVCMYTCIVHRSLQKLFSRT